MRQKAGFNIYGAVASIRKHITEQKLELLVIVNKCNEYGQHVSQKPYYVTLYDSAAKDLMSKVQKGDMIKIDECDIEINYQTKTVAINCRYSGQVLLIARQNRETILTRDDETTVDLSFVQETPDET
jgi:hypothetical protein